MEAPRAFAVELAPGWRKFARRRSDAELEEINTRLHELQLAFGRPHLHAGLGLRRLRDNVFEFRASQSIRVVFLFLKPRLFRLEMCGDHDEVRAWLKSHR